MMAFKRRAIALAEGHFLIGKSRPAATAGWNSVNTTLSQPTQLS
jgi:hypothetical protein